MYSFSYILCTYASLNFQNYSFEKKCFNASKHTIVYQNYAWKVPNSNYLVYLINQSEELSCPFNFITFKDFTVLSYKCL